MRSKPFSVSGYVAQAARGFSWEAGNTSGKLFAHTNGGINMNRSVAIVLTVLLACAVAGAMAQEAKKGSLRTRVEPSDAGVFVNGKYYGSANMFVFRARPLELPPGTYDVELVDPRCKTLKVRAEIKAGMMTTIRHSMECAAKVPGPFGELATEGFGNSAIYLNGKYYGNTSDAGILIGPGTYDLKIAPVDGSEGREGKVTINADETLLLTKGAADVRRK